MTEKERDLLKAIKYRNSKEKQPYENILKSCKYKSENDLPHSQL